MDKISIVIISYNRPSVTIETLKNILYEVDDVPNFEKEIILINNGSTVDYAEVENFLAKENATINYIDNPDNLGVSGGRNIGIKAATGKYISFIDDDAVFKNRDSLKMIHQKFTEYADQNIGVIGFCIENFYSGEPDYPVKNQSKLVEDEFLNNIFWGGGSVFRKEVFEKSGEFDASFFYGMEEYDLGYRIIDKGYKILFTKNITVLHKVSPDGRETNLVKISRFFKNKSIVAYRYLPWPYVISHILIWSVYLLFKSKGNIFLLFRNWSSLYKAIKVNQGTPISNEAISYVKSVSGRLIY